MLIILILRFFGPVSTGFVFSAGRAYFQQKPDDVLHLKWIWIHWMENQFSIRNHFSLRIEFECNPEPKNRNPIQLWVTKVFTHLLLTSQVIIWLIPNIRCICSAAPSNWEPLHWMWIWRILVVDCYLGLPSCRRPSGATQTVSAAGPGHSDCGPRPTNGSLINQSQTHHIRSPDYGQLPHSHSRLGREEVLHQAG